MSAPRNKMVGYSHAASDGIAYCDFCGWGERGTYGEVFDLYMSHKDSCRLIPWHKPTVEERLDRVEQALGLGTK